jgi:hypothetical protein
MPKVKSSSPTQTSLITNLELSVIETSDEALLSVSDIYNTLPENRRPSLRTFTNWNAQGYKFALIAGGGSVYALLLIAGLDLRYRVTQLIGRTAWEVGKMLRRPETAGERFFWKI